jgi:histone-lysine N-methyltransferase SETMAR
MFIDVFPRGQTINSNVHVEILRKCFRKVRHHTDVPKVLLLQGNAMPHTSLHTREAIIKLQWIVLPHPPYCPDLAPSNYHRFSHLKDIIHGKKSEDDKEDISEVKRWLRQRHELWYREGIQALTSRWRKAIDLKGDYIENWI